MDRSNMPFFKHGEDGGQRNRLLLHLLIFNQGNECGVYCVGLTSVQFFVLFRKVFKHEIQVIYLNDSNKRCEVKLDWMYKAFDFKAEFQ